MLKNNNVATTKLCCGCGTCKSICPVNAIEIVVNKKGFYIPNIDSDKCTNCGLCLKVCPDVNEKSNFDSKLNAYITNSKNKELRYNASSGGFVTQFLIDLLQSKKIDGAVVINSYTKNKPKSIIATTKKEFIEAKGSKYCPVATNTILKKLDKFEGKFAFVGLPCQLQALDKYLKLKPKLKNKIIVKIGLVCNHTPSFKATEYLYWINRMNLKDSIETKYRGQGWPGKGEIRTKQKSKFLSELWSTGFGDFFYNDACLNCKDTYVNHADMFVMDPWNTEFKSDKGYTLIAIRNKLDLIKNSKNIDFKAVNSNIINQSLSNFEKYKLKTKPKSQKLGYSKLHWPFIYIKYYWKAPLRKLKKFLK